MDALSVGAQLSLAGVRRADRFLKKAKCIGVVARPFHAAMTASCTSRLRALNRESH
jgi:hypothetical protein